MTRNKLEDEEDTCAWNMPRMTQCGPVAQVTTLEIWKQEKKKQKKEIPPAIFYYISFTATPSLLGPFDPKEGPPS